MFNKMCSIEFVLILTFSLCFRQANAIQCYQCTSCSRPLDRSHAAKPDNCKSCKTEIVYRVGSIRSINRTCVRQGQTCKASGKMVSKSGNVTMCCYTNLCNTNGGKRIATTKATFIILATLTMLLR
ncbi:unnamed protein product [Calicophoron daubneyi]|uniref:Uncharacterized protein n=1 Tax=Calicophoron daubneyi TaxID=300641 RepID=A0AAV2TVQ0_CALDB